jgi:hypothetical protein
MESRPPERQMGNPSVSGMEAGEKIVFFAVAQKASSFPSTARLNSCFL